MWTDVLNACFQWGAQSVTYLWLPVLAWSLCCALALYASDRFERLRLSYASLYGLLLMLPVGIVLNGVLQSTSSGTVTEVVSSSAVYVVPAPVVTPEAVTAPAEAWPAFTALLMVVLCIAAVAALIAFLFSGLRAVRLLITSWMLPQSVTSAVVPALVLDEVATQAKRLGIQRPIRVEVSNTLTSPHTYGWRSPVLILPAALAEQPDELRMACLHELAHIQRHDFALHWLDLLISEVFFFVPMVRRVRARLHLQREQACDRAVLTHSNLSARRYAQFLLQYVTANSPRPALALTLHAPDSELKHRVRAMKDSSSSQKLTPMQTGLLAALLMASAAALIIALSQAFSPNAPQLEREIPITEQPLIEEEEIPVDASSEVFVIVEQMPQLIGGLEGLQETIRYPRIAQQAGIAGRVFVQFVVGTDGRVSDAYVTRGIGAGCDEEAIRAVSEARFVPGKQRGKTVPVKMSLPITFRLNEVETTASVDTPAVQGAKLQLTDFSGKEGIASGIIQDANTGQPLAGANIVIPGTSRGTVSDREGRFTFNNLTEDGYPLQVSFVGYETLSFRFAMPTTQPIAEAEIIEELLEDSRALRQERLTALQRAISEREAPVTGLQLSLVRSVVAEGFVDGEGQRFQLISGTVKDTATDLPAAGAHVTIANGLEIGEITDADGRFTLDYVPMGKHKLQIRSLGYQTVTTEAIGSSL
ncbi:MAG: hypothetical protein RhofKO_29590 [Rhodothermales bacterium]